MRIIRRKIGAAILPLFAPPTLRMLARSWKLEEVNVERFEEAQRAHGCIVTLWHGRMLLAIAAHGGRGHRVLVSPSDDGALVLGLLTRFGYGTIRGSSNKSPARALRAMLASLDDGETIIITPDGPRGPRHSVNRGAVWMARSTGYPIVPCGLVAAPARRLKSWDHFTIPKFGARVVITYGEPLMVAKETPDSELDALANEMRRRMIAAEESGFARLGVGEDW